ncbi:FHA domain-containing protein [Lysobacter antibioticus]|uniref:FHA domain-containing protein n=1 Tax=Lysobacter antibioticus TaxID=84531 RepID=UPI000345669E|nr:FHA domain-containing protein [Lysobacter antibioticus]
MQARLIVYPPDQAAIARALRPGETVSIGRASECDLVVGHASISRRHAQLDFDQGQWRLRDLDSKNGSFVDGIAAGARGLALDGGCWLRLGDVYCEFAPLADAEIAAAERGQIARRAVAAAHTARLEGVQGLGDLLDGSLRAVVELAQCERGFVLLEDGAGYRVRASLALDPGRLHAREFGGSVGAVRKALESRRAVVVNDIGREAWLASRDSVIAAGLSALVCLPLLDGERTLGALYADRVRPGPAITTLDLELLQAFTEGAAVWIAACRTSEQLDAQLASAAWDGIVAAHAGDA